MSTQLQLVLDAALLLPEPERGELAARLMDTLDEMPEFHPEWDAEIQRRIEDMRSGRVPGIPLAQLRKELMDIRDGTSG